MYKRVVCVYFKEKEEEDEDEDEEDEEDDEKEEEEEEEKDQSHPQVVQISAFAPPLTACRFSGP